MKVLQLTTHLNIGGIANYILSLTSALKQRGIDCLVVSSGGNLEDEFKRHNIATRRLDIKTKFEFGPKVFMSIFSLARIIKDEKVDLIHAHTRVSQVVANLASRITGVAYVTTCHGFFKKRMRRIFDTWGTKVIAISDAVSTHLEKDLGVDKRRIEIIYNGVDIDRFSKGYPIDMKEKARRELGLKGGPIIGTIGRLSPVKGQNLLIQAMSGIILKRDDAQALIIGDGPEELALKGLAKSLGLEDSIQFVRSNLDTHKFLSIMDIFVLPSIKEGLGLSLLEAMAKGLPCIASDIGGISNIVKDGQTGMLFPVGDVKRLTDSVVRLLNDEPLKLHLGETAKIFVMERFSLDIMADKVSNLYKKVLESHAV